MFTEISMKICRVTEIDIKNRTFCFFNEIINIKNLVLNNILVDEKSSKNIFIYYVAYVTPNMVKAFYFTINNSTGYLEEIMEISIRH